MMKTGLLGSIMLAALAAPAAAYDSFRSPSGNIHCAYFGDGSLRCDIAETEGRAPRRPADCDLDWGNAFEMTERSRRAGRICHGDTVMDPDAAVLSYGSSWSGGGFSCLSSARGISCRNARGAGWDLSRSSQVLY